MTSRRLDVRIDVPTLLLVAVCLAGCGGSDPRTAPPQPPPSPGPSPNDGAIYVSPQGRPDNDGSQARPLDLATALSTRGPARPGQTIWLRGGTYVGAYASHLAGRSDAPIIVRAVPGERAVIDGANGDARERGVALEVQGAYTWFWGLEVTYSGTSRTDSGRPSAPGGITVSESTGVKLINLTIHDMPGYGLAMWSEGVDTELYGAVIYHNGTNHFDHGVYAQNKDGAKRLEDNVIFGQASHGIHVYGSEAAFLDHFSVSGNVVFNNGLLTGTPERNILVGGLTVAHDVTIAENVTYYAPDQALGSNNVGYRAGCASTSVTGNYFVGANALTMANCQPTRLEGNTLVGSLEPPDLLDRYPGNTFAAAPPTGVHVIVRANRYEAGRATVVIFNWDLKAEVPVDLSKAGLTSGRGFTIVDLQDPLGPPVATGTYTGAPVVLPMTGLRVAAPVWNEAVRQVHTTPEFGVFLVLPA